MVVIPRPKQGLSYRGRRPRVSQLVPPGAGQGAGVTFVPLTAMNYLLPDSFDRMLQFANEEVNLQR